ncbi:MAG: SusC/RagA family TonB-linked outer membrane protein, partial [Muribaculaceae bacterium]|nr:SusC/RagA family TonB-linked outer membrane protein [Muribaculaceae bacterium]
MNKQRKGISALTAALPLAMLMASGNISYAAATATPDLTSVHANAHPQSFSVSGVVTDNNGDPLPGVTVRIAGSDKGTSTGLDGDFTINAAKGDKIQFTYIGYMPQTQTVSSDTPLRIRMNEDSRSLQEVVVVGYGTQKKANLTGAVASLSSEELENRPITNLSQGLQGMIGNLNISADNGAPGKGYGFNVRGTTSVNSAGPLVLVDGVQMDPNLINPADVESVSVLKDAASASIYGTQAAYGVILITTKKGREQNKPQISFSSNWSWNKPTVQPEYIDSWTFANFHNLVNRNSGGGDYYDQTQMEHIWAYYTDPDHNLPVYIDPSNPDKYMYCGNTDWIDEVRKTTSFVQQYTLSISGGNDRTTYYGSVGFLDQGGQLKFYDDKYQRFNAAMNLSTNITKWLNVG